DLRPPVPEQLGQRADHLRGEVVDAEVALVLEHRHRGRLPRPREPRDDHQVSEGRALRAAGVLRARRTVLGRAPGRFHASKLDGDSGRASRGVPAADRVRGWQPVRRRGPVIAFLCAALLGLAAAAPAGALVTAVVGGPSAAPPVASGFLGFSMEFYAVHEYAGTNPDAINPVLVQLIRNLNPGQAP